MAHPHPEADVFVRPAVEDDAAAIARIQLASWLAGHLVAEQMLGPASAQQFTDVWQATIAGANQRQAVLVACERATVVGFAAATAALDPDSGDAAFEITALEVAPDRQRRGHGARLLAACVDTIAALGGQEAQIWIPQANAAREQFLASAGFAADGAWRELQADSGQRTTVRRWSCALA